MITTLTGIHESLQQKYFALFDEASKFLADLPDGKAIDTFTYIEVALDAFIYEQGQYYIYNANDGVYELDVSVDWDADKTYYYKSSGIRTLEDYFCYLGTLAENGAKDKFFMLPLNEEVFVIDANTRSITVPASFKKSGLGVEGDKAAETILFIVDRFYDVIDLATTEIYVQWEKALKNGTTKQYVSLIEQIDIETLADEGKIIFGWPISENVAATAGTVKFAVRFIKTDGAENVEYSFGTLPATATINASLNYDIFGGEVVEDTKYSDLFKNIIENSQKYDGKPAVEPVYVITPEQVITLVNNGAEVMYSTYVSDNGDVNYIWYYKAEGDNVKRQNLAIDKAVGGVVGVPEGGYSYYTITQEFAAVDADAELLSNRNYYVLNESVPPAYERYNPVVDLGKQVYERITKLNISGQEPEGYEDVASPVAGSYYVRAVNRVGGRESRADSPIAKILNPVVPVINADVPENATIAEAGGSALLQASAHADAEASNIKYAWYHSMNKDMTDAEIVPDIASDALLASSIGYYQARVMNSLNLGRVSVMTGVTRVVNLPEAPVWAEGYGEADERRYLDITNPVIEIPLASATADILNNELYSDGLTFNWYIRDIDDTDADNEDDLWMTGGELQMVDGITKVVLPIMVAEIPGGYVYCKAINHLNGYEAVSAASCKFAF